MIGSIVIGAGAKKLAGFVFDNPLGQIVAGGLLFVATFAIWLWQHDLKVASAAKTEMATELNTDAEKLSHEAIKSRLPADRPGALERLRKGSCSDCNG